jgi:hypothetical protein
MTSVLRTALGLLRRHAGAAYLASALATLVNTVPDVVRKVLVWDDPSRLHAFVVAVVGVLTALAAQLWVTGALAGLPSAGVLRLRGALRRGTALAWRAVRAAPGTVLAGVVAGGAVSALVTFPASVAALGWDRMYGPLDAPGVGAFTLAAASDVLASWLTLPFLALVLVLAGTPRTSAGSVPPRSGTRHR